MKTCETCNGKGIIPTWTWIDPDHWAIDPYRVMSTRACYNPRCKHPKPEGVGVYNPQINEIRLPGERRGE